MSKPEIKIIFEQHGSCPWCSKQIHTKYIRVTKTPMVKAQTELVFSLEKDMQTTLEEDYAASLTPEERRIAIKKAAKLDKKVKL